MKYQDYPYTIGITSLKGENKMIPIKKWIDRDETCQPIKPYEYNILKYNEIAFVLERLLVIDIDRGHAAEVDGAKSFNEWTNNQPSEKIIEIKDALSKTLRVLTPREGMHIYFLLPENIDPDSVKKKVSYLPGVDLLTGRNAYTPVPGTTRNDGQYLKVENSPDEIIEAPEWLIELFSNEYTKEEERISQRGTFLQRGQLNGGNTYNNGKTASLDIIFDSIRYGYCEGERHDNMVKLCGTVINYVKYGKLSQENAEFIVETTAMNCSPPMQEKEYVGIFNSILDREIKKIRSGKA